MITHDIYINLVEVVPSLHDFNNVASKVHWEIIFTDGTYVSRGGGFTILDTSNLVDFTPADQLTESQVAEWVRTDLTLRGFEQELINYHSAAIEEQHLQQKLKVWNQPLLDQKTRPFPSEMTIKV